MHSENATPSESLERGSAARDADPRRRESGGAESAPPPTPEPTAPSDPVVFRTWHPDTCDERRLRRGAR